MNLCLVGGGFNGFSTLKQRKICASLPQQNAKLCVYFLISFQKLNHMD